MTTNENDDVVARGPSGEIDSATGSPRSPHPDGSQLCTCGVLTGGARDPRPGCQVHPSRWPTDEERFNEKTHTEGRTILRVAKELRGFLEGAPAGDAEAQSLLRDCDTLERVGNWLASTNAVTFSDGISVR